MPARQNKQHQLIKWWWYQQLYRVWTTVLHCASIINSLVYWGIRSDKSNLNPKRIIRRHSADFFRLRKRLKFRDLLRLRFYQSNHLSRAFKIIIISLRIKYQCWDFRKDSIILKPIFASLQRDLIKQAKRLIEDLLTYKKYAFFILRWEEIIIW